MVLQMQQINTLNEKIAIMNARHFGRSTGKLDTLPGQMNIYNEADTAAAETIAELVVPSTIVVLKAENRRGLRPPDVQKLQNIMLLNLCRFQQESFIQNQQLGTHVCHQDLLVAFCIRAISSSNGRSGRRIYLVLKRCLQASMPRAQTIWALPLPDAPVIGLWMSIFRFLGVHNCTFLDNSTNI